MRHRTRKAEEGSIGKEDQEGRVTSRMRGHEDSKRKQEDAREGSLKKDTGETGHTPTQ